MSLDLVSCCLSACLHACMHGVLCHHSMYRSAHHTSMQGMLFEHPSSSTCVWSPSCPPYLLPDWPSTALAPVSNHPPSQSTRSCKIMRVITNQTWTPISVSPCTPDTAGHLVPMCLMLEPASHMAPNSLDAPPDQDTLSLSALFNPICRHQTLTPSKQSNTSEEGVPPLCSEHPVHRGTPSHHTSGVAPNMDSRTVPAVTFRNVPALWETGQEMLRSRAVVRRTFRLKETCFYRPPFYQVAISSDASG